MFKIGDKVKLLSNSWLLKSGEEVIITNIHATTDMGGSNYELIYHIRKRKTDRYEFIFKEKELEKI